MRRTIEFNYQDNEYYLEENGARIFAIKATDLKFNSLDFYKGVYKGKSVDITLENRIANDPPKKGGYIFGWLSEIVLDIKKELSEELGDEDSERSPRIIRLYEFAACAGSGSFFDDVDVPYEDIEDTTGEADYAVRISGDSMEPTIKDKSIVFVKKAEEVNHEDVGLFIVNGDLMCKRYIKQERDYKLVPDNCKYDTIQGKEDSSIECIGKVILNQDV